MEKVADTRSFALQEIRVHVVIVSRVFLLLLGKEWMWNRLHVSALHLAADCHSHGQ
jgi:hypothetical protein